MIKSLRNVIKQMMFAGVVLMTATVFGQVSLVQDYAVDSDNFDISYITEYNGELYFAGLSYDPTDSIYSELYKYDPIEEKISLAANIKYNDTTAWGIFIPSIILPQ